MWAVIKLFLSCTEPFLATPWHVPVHTQSHHLGGSISPPSLLRIRFCVVGVTLLKHFQELSLLPLVCFALDTSGWCDKIIYGSSTFSKTLHWFPKTYWTQLKFCPDVKSPTELALSHLSPVCLTGWHWFGKWYLPNKPCKFLSPLESDWVRTKSQLYFV